MIEKEKIVMGITPTFVVLPLTAHSNTLILLINEIRYQEKQLTFDVEAGDQQTNITRNQFVEEVKQEILRRFEELEKRTAEAEKSLLGAIGRCNVLEQTLTAQTPLVRRGLLEEGLDRDDKEFYTTGSGAN